ncbi:MAG: TonB family protein [Acidobacteria bacterium]|nr:TonB family protein [Acidobacteriota bacterium]
MQFGAHATRLLDFYGLREQPFGVTPDPRYFYAGETHCEALATLVCGIEHNVGFGALVSEPGMGKTTLLCQLMEQFRSAETAFVFNTQCGSNDLLRAIADDLHIEPGGADSFGLVPAINRHLIRNAGPNPTIVVIDEAQNLDDSVLETVRMLSNFETPKRKLLHIILSGQPLLGEKLLRPHLKQLWQRITILARLQPFGEQEIAAYIRHRLETGGCRQPIFAPGAVSDIATASQGIPREINRLCFNSLLLGCASGEKIIGRRVVQEVCGDLQLLPDRVRTGGKPQRLVADAGHSANTAGETLPVRGMKRSSSTPSAAPVRVPWQEGPQPLERAGVGMQDMPLKQSRHGQATLPALGLLSLALLLFAVAATHTGFRADLEGAWKFWESKVNVPATPATKTAGAVVAGRPAIAANPAAAVLSPAAQDLTVANQRPVSLFPLGNQGKVNPVVVAAPVLESIPLIHVPSRFPPASTTATLESYGSPPRLGAAPVQLASLPPSPAHLPKLAEFKLEQPVVLKQVEPVYPPLARQAGIQGNVQIAATVGKDGKLRDVHVVSGDPALSGAALDAVRQWLLSPASFNGQPIEVEKKITIHFVLPQQ